ncbi:hypothetical protein [Sphingomonas sp. UV9]|nr:hypothetical protein [Sphingomonas sp. UV9]
MRRRAIVPQRRIVEGVYRRLQEELDWSEVDARSFGDNILTAT